MRRGKQTLNDVSQLKHDTYADIWCLEDVALGAPNSPPSLRENCSPSPNLFQMLLYQLANTCLPVNIYSEVHGFSMHCGYSLVCAYTWLCSVKLRKNLARYNKIAAQRNNSRWKAGKEAPFLIENRPIFVYVYLTFLTYAHVDFILKLFPAATIHICNIKL